VKNKIFASKSLLLLLSANPLALVNFAIGLAENILFPTLLNKVGEYFHFWQLLLQKNADPQVRQRLSILDPLLTVLAQILISNK